MARIEAGDLSIGYAERGSGEAIVFLHGVGTDKELWADQLAYFSQRRRAVAIDYPGYGESDAPPHELRREQIAGYITGALNSLGIERAHVVGLSMGGVIALEMWRQRPERLLSLTLADTFAKHPEGEAILERSLRLAATVTMRELAESRITALLQPAATPAMKQIVIENMARINPRAYAWAARAVWSADYTADVKRIETPTLILVGEHDAVTPIALSQELQRSIPHARLQVIPAAGHLSNFDNPVAFNSAVTEFLDSQDFVF